MSLVTGADCCVFLPCAALRSEIRIPAISGRGHVERATGAATRVPARKDNMLIPFFLPSPGHCRLVADRRFGGGLFQTAPERSDGRNLTPLDFDNRNFRNCEGDLVP